MGSFREIKKESFLFERLADTSFATIDNNSNSVCLSLFTLMDYPIQ